MAKPFLFEESKALDRLTVRLADEATERERYDGELVEGHYLKSVRCAGQTLRYIIELDGQWVALLTFSAAALHLKARDKFIGWSARQRARRLALIVNNSRFCLLLDRARYPNFASKALSLVLRRLSDDWLQHWGHPVFAVESFVDESRYPGTCYRACGFTALGATAGFSRTAKDFYTYHGEPKALYFRELHPPRRCPPTPVALAQGTTALRGIHQWPVSLARRQPPLAVGTISHPARSTPRSRTFSHPGHRVGLRCRRRDAGRQRL